MKALCSGKKARERQILCDFTNVESKRQKQRTPTCRKRHPICGSQRQRLGKLEKGDQKLHNPLCPSRNSSLLFRSSVASRYIWVWNCSCVWCEVGLGARAPALSSCSSTICGNDFPFPVGWLGCPVTSAPETNVGVSRLSLWFCPHAQPPSRFLSLCGES